MKISLSKPSKMPCPSWSIPTKYCNVGVRLQQVEGSVCFSCYARKGRYVFPNVQKAQELRYEQWNSNRTRWCDTMVDLIYDLPYFRWFDSGDIQGELMLFDIMNVVMRTPHTLHWLPTKEAYLVAKHKQFIDLHPNVCVRVSLPMIGDKRPANSLFATSGVQAKGFTCPSSKQGGKCLDCRKCWDPAVRHVIYKEH